MCLFKLLLSFVLLAYNTGFSAEIPVFVKTGDSVQLDLQTQEPPQFDLLSWSNDKAKNIAKYINGTKEVKLLFPFEGRVYLNAKTFSLTLKNMQKTDSGLYTAKISGDSDKNIVTYRVSVIDEVESPVLNSSWSSFNLCSVTCRASNINVTFIYNGSRCSQEEVTTADNHILKVNCSDDSIMCNYSNPVSWKTKIKTVNDVCSVSQEISSEKLQRRSWFVTLICILALFLLGSVIGVCFNKRRKERSFNPDQQNDDHTLYDQVGENVKQEKPLEMETSERPTTVYDTVRERRLPNDTAETNTSPNSDPANQNTTEKSKPNSPVTVYKEIQQSKSETDHTIYAAVNKPTARNETEHP